MPAQQSIRHLKEQSGTKRKNKCKSRRKKSRKNSTCLPESQALGVCGQNYLHFGFLLSLMASLIPPLPSTLASFLSMLLPHGFAVGPSRLCEGRLGLWWVGRSLDIGSLLGMEGDTEWSSGRHTETVMDELTMNSGCRTEQSSSTEVFKLKSAFFK